MSSPAYAHMGLNCRDIDATVAFYTKHFGFETSRTIPLGDDKIVFLKSGEVYLELFKAQGDAPEQFVNDGPAYPGFRHIAFKVDDVDATLNAIGKDVEVTLGPMGFDDFIKGWKSVWVRDPDGRIIEISQGYRD
ncbi:MAG: VOC family protein [Thermoanaerobaculia bacterium]